ncbi:MAG: hypothetical protein HC880_06770, partial [Bacteroidia bacterium]|nr:hypothetical protein [Bacteroidia bacterium]
PLCSSFTRLFHHTLLNWGRTRGRPCDARNPADHWCPRCGELNFSHEVENTTCKHCNFTYNAGVGSVHQRRCTCESCGSSFAPREGLAHGSTLELVAIEYIDPDTGQKLFKMPDEFDKQRFYQPLEIYELPDLGVIPPGVETQRLHNNGFHHWKDMFTPRQLIGYATLFKSAQKLADPFHRLITTLAISSTLEYNCGLVAYNFKYRKSPSSVYSPCFPNCHSRS